MNPNRIMLLNGILFVVIVGLSALMLTQEYQVPGEPPVRALRQEVDKQLAQSEADTDETGNELKNFGKVNLFDTIIPTPTPKPTPSPTPPVPPDIRDVTEDWKLGGVTSQYALFQNLKTREDFSMKIGDHKTVRFRGKDINVYLDSIDKGNWSATVRIEELDKVQKRSFSVF